MTDETITERAEAAATRRRWVGVAEPIIATYGDADVQRHDSAIYDGTWKTEGRVRRGRALRLERLKLRERTSSTARLETIWAREKPQPAS